MIAYGPVAQLPHYHEFADQSHWFGIPHSEDVLSNLGYALVALWGAIAWWRAPQGTMRKPARYGYTLFLASLLCTALGSSWYHLAPDDARLVWDRLPIALACAGLLAAMRAETHPHAHPWRDVVVLFIFAVGSVAWWRFTDVRGAGDLRPYLLLQALPLIVIPLWQWIYGATRTERRLFALAVVLYMAAKVAELYDPQILSGLGWLSGHTIKHLLSSLAACLIVKHFIGQG